MDVHLKNRGSNASLSEEIQNTRRPPDGGKTFATPSTEQVSHEMLLHTFHETKEIILEELRFTHRMQKRTSQELMDLISIMKLQVVELVTKMSTSSQTITGEKSASSVQNVFVDNHNSYKKMETKALKKEMNFISDTQIQTAELETTNNLKQIQTTSREIFARLGPPKGNNFESSNSNSEIGSSKFKTDYSQQDKVSGKISNCLFKADWGAASNGFDPGGSQ